MNINKILIGLLTIKPSIKLLKKGITVRKPSSVNISKSADISVTGTFLFNNEWDDRSKIYNKKVGILKIGDNAKVDIGNLTCFSGCRLSVGNNAVFKVEDCYMNYDCVIDCREKIEIGKHCLIGERVKISDSNKHRICSDEFKVHNPIKIKTHVWICNDATILSGVTIGCGAVIAAGSVVTKDVPPRTLVAGVPARIVKEDIDWEE